MRSLSQTHNFALDWNGYRVIVYAIVITMELEPGVYYHTLTEFSHAVTPLTRWRRFLWSLTIRPPSNVLDGLVRQWFMEEYGMFSRNAEEQYKL